MRGMTGYAYAAASGSTTSTVADAGYVVKAAFPLSGAVSATNAKLISFDPDLLAKTDGDGAIVLDITKTLIVDTKGQPDYDNLSAFGLDSTELNARLTAIVGNTNSLARRLTSIVDATESATGAEAVRFVIIEPAEDNGGSYAGSTSVADDNAVFTAAKITFPLKDEADSSATSGGALSSFSMPFENVEKIPEIDIKVDSIAITAQTKKLKAKWTPELGQDLNAYHNLDAEVELTSILSEQIALEIDREILADLVNGAKAGTFYWSRSPGLFVNRVTGAEIGQTSAAPDFTGTVSEWYETLIETMNDVSAQIHRKTLRGGANFCVVSPEVANVLEFTAGFRANVTADADKGEIGAVKIGSLSRKFDVIVDPYFPRNVILMGRKGNSFLESGYVYAPYVPLQTTPTIFGVEDFVPRKGVMTRYAKKMVRPDMYGLVIVRGLLGESGS